MKPKHLVEIFGRLPEIRDSISQAVNDTFLKFRLRAVPLLVTCTLLMPINGKKAKANSRIDKLTAGINKLRKHQKIRGLSPIPIAPVASYNETNNASETEDVDSVEEPETPYSNSSQTSFQEYDEGQESEKEVFPEAVSDTDADKPGGTQVVDFEPEYPWDSEDPDAIPGQTHLDKETEDSQEVSNLADAEEPIPENETEENVIDEHSNAYYESDEPALEMEPDSISDDTGDYSSEPTIEPDSPSIETPHAVSDDSFSPGEAGESESCDD